MTDWLKKISPCLHQINPGETQVSYTGQADTPTDWVEPLRVIYDHELVIFSKGSYIVEIDGVEYPCPQHTYIIVPCGRLHASWSTGQRGHRYWAHFDWTWQDQQSDTPIFTYHPARSRAKLYRHAPHYVPNRIIHGQIAMPEKMYDLAERLCALQYLGGSYNRLVSRAILLEILVGLLHPNDYDDRVSSSILDPASRARELIKQSVARDREIPPIQELLGSTGYSYAHLCRAFRGRYGISPLKYVHALRVSRAKMLLSDTGLSISEIAYRVGFNDTNYFTQLFKKMTGLTPSAFRRGRWSVTNPE